MELEVHDIDVQTDEESAYKLGTQLSKYIVEPIQFCGTDKIRSHFGKTKIHDIDVETRLQLNLMTLIQDLPLLIESEE